MDELNDEPKAQYRDDGRAALSHPRHRSQLMSLRVQNHPGRESDERGRRRDAGCIFSRPVHRAERGGVTGDSGTIARTEPSRRH